MASETPSRYYLLTTPRTASNMLVRVLNLDEQPNIVPEVQKEYFFLDSFLAQRPFRGRKPIEEWTDEEKKERSEALQPCLDSFKAHLNEAKAEGKNVFIKEHVIFLNEPVAESEFLFDTDSGQSPLAEHAPEQTRTPGNTTIWSDELLKTFYPTFLIRHPAIAFPSHCRTILDTQGPEGLKSYGDRCNEVSYHFPRLLYDWYRRNLRSTQTNDPDATWPVVLDTDDILAGPELVVKYAKIVGFDPEKLKFSWDVATTEQLDKQSPLVQRMLSTLQASTGVMNKKTSENINVDEEAAKWREEFGEEVGAKVEKFVRDALPDYEYLRKKKLALS